MVTTCALSAFDGENARNTSPNEGDVRKSADELWAAVGRALWRRGGGELPPEDEAPGIERAKSFRAGEVPLAVVLSIPLVGLVAFMAGA